MTAADMLGCAIRHGLVLGLCSRPYTGLSCALWYALDCRLDFTFDSAMRSAANDGIDLGLHNGLYNRLINNLKIKTGNGP